MEERDSCSCSFILMKGKGTHTYARVCVRTGSGRTHVKEEQWLYLSGTIRGMFASLSLLLHERELLCDTRDMFISLDKADGTHPL